MVVTIVAFEPVEDGLHSIGGFDWAYSRADALQALRAHLTDEAGCPCCKDTGCFNYTLRSVELPDNVRGRDNITAWLILNVDMRVLP